MAGNRALIYESIIRDMSEGIMTIDLNGTINSFNPAAERILGIKKDETIGQQFAKVFIGNQKNDIFTQSVLYAMTDQEAGETRCTLGLTDPSGRLHMRKDLLSFAIPWKRFLEMEADAEGSFLTKETWTKLKERIE